MTRIRKTTVRQLGQVKLNNKKQLSKASILLREVVGFQKTDRDLLLDCRGGVEPRRIGVRLSFLSSKLFNLRIQVEGKIEESKEGGYPFEFISSAEQLELTTDALKVIVRKRPFTLEICDLSDKRLTSLQEVSISTETSPPTTLRSRLVFSASAKERFFGFGQRHNSVDQTGRVIKMVSVDSLEGKDDTTYCPIPFFMSTGGYGVCLWTDCISEFDMRTEREGTYSIASEDYSLNVYFFHGPRMKDILASYVRFTGMPVKIPRWSFGVLQGRCFLDSKEVEEIRRQFEVRDIPLSIMYFDWLSFRPNPKLDYLAKTPQQYMDLAESMGNSLIAQLRRKGVQTMAWIPSWISEVHPLFQEGIEKGYFYRNLEGDYIREFGPRIDFTNPKAYEWFKQRVKKQLRSGIRAFLSDFGDSIPWFKTGYQDEGLNFYEYEIKDLEPEQGTFCNGKTTREFNNFYSILQRRAVCEAVKEEGLEGQVYLLVRGGYTGIQKYGAVYTGDNNVDYDYMRVALRAMLSLGLSGVPYTTSNNGGLRLSRRKDVTIRWTQMGVFTPLFSAWCGDPDTDLPWHFGDEATAIHRYYAWLRMNLIPYIYSYAERTCETGLPIAQALVLKYQDDPEAVKQETEYLFGEEFLVAPMYPQEAINRRRVYLPEGRWIDYWTDEEYEGPQYILYEADWERFPLFLRAGAIVPMELNADYEIGGSLSQSKGLVFDVHPHKYSEFTLFDNEKKTKIVCQEGESRLIIEIEPCRQEYALRVKWPYPAKVMVDGLTSKKYKEFTEFKKVKEGWFYDEESKRCIIKVYTQHKVKVELLV